MGTWDLRQRLEVGPTASAWFGCSLLYSESCLLPALGGQDPGWTLRAGGRASRVALLPSCSLCFLPPPGAGEGRDRLCPLRAHSPLTGHLTPRSVSRWESGRGDGVQEPLIWPKAGYVKFRQ